MEGLDKIPDLDVPSKQIRDTFGWRDEPMSNRQRIQEYEYSHPCPSWSHIMRQLQDMGLTEAAKKASEYIKGLVNSPLKHICTCAHVKSTE